MDRLRHVLSATGSQVAQPISGDTPDRGRNRIRPKFGMERMGRMDTEDKFRSGLKSPQIFADQLEIKVSSFRNFR